jgi:hypothetical protein
MSYHFTTTIPDYYPSQTRSLYQQKETATGLSDDDGDDGNLIDNLQMGAKAAVVIGLIFGIIFIVAFSMWFCCGCCGIRDKRGGLAPDGAQRTSSDAMPSGATGNILPLHNIQSRSPSNAYPPPVDPSPPSYEETVSPRNQAPPGGMQFGHRIDDDGIIPNGKTPLSEIGFEDVVLDRPHTGESSSQTFEQRHHGSGGNTRGHTNT